MLILVIFTKRSPKKDSTRDLAEFYNKQTGSLNCNFKKMQKLKYQKVKYSGR
jgi:hypothetical protein